MLSLFFLPNVSGSLVKEGHLLTSKWLAGRDILRKAEEASSASAVGSACLKPSKELELVGWSLPKLN